MKRAERLYDQSATHFSLQFFIRSGTQVAGRFVTDLTTILFDDLFVPGSCPFWLATKRPGLNQKMNMGDFSDRRWTASVKKITAGEYSVVWLRAHVPDGVDQEISLSVHVNETGGPGLLVSGSISLTCSIPYLRQLTASHERIESLLRFGSAAWNGIDGGPAYGFGNLAIIVARPPFRPGVPRTPGDPMPWDIINPPAERAHAVPVAYEGNDIDGNLSSFYCSDRGIKGAFWANYLSSAHVTMAGGESALRTTLDGIRVEPLKHGGLLVVTTGSPLPPDTDETRDRFVRLTDALQPAFLSRDALPESKRALLGYFFRERASVLP
jgi:hypothetical protein